MFIESFTPEGRTPRKRELSADLVVVGGGLAGVCASITAARQGISVILAQDRPVLGGNASSEVRLWALGATSHMGNNNRWAREGGVIDEILVENLFRNKEGNPLILDTILLEKATEEPNITLLLNTSVYEARKSAADRVECVRAYCSQNSTAYRLRAPLFCDASGDGILAFCAGAAFRMGAEKAEEFGERFAPDESYGELLGHTIYFYSKDAGHPVKYVAPSFALKDINAIPRFRNITSNQQGCNFWWFEYGGRRDTVHETEEIKWELWRAVYGVWDYIKNSGEFPDAGNLTLEWVGLIPGKRESRRFEGPYMLKQQDVVEQRPFDDAVAFGGWSLDLHPADAIYSDRPGCNQWHAKGIYAIPYRCYFSRNISNLFLAGRIISASHVAFGSSRVMLTCAHGGQAVGMAAALCAEQRIEPRDLLEKRRMEVLQERLNLAGQSIPGTEIQGGGNLALEARLLASSSLELKEFPAADRWRSLAYPAAQMLPMKAGTAYRMRIPVFSRNGGSLTVELRCSETAGNYTPEIVKESHDFDLRPGEQIIDVAFSESLDADQYGMICFFADDSVSVRESDFRATGLLSVFRHENKAVSNAGRQEPPDDIGVESFDFWIPQRRPEGRNLAMTLNPPIRAFEPEMLRRGLIRPTTRPNAWVASPEEEQPELTVDFDEVKTLERITLYFDTDYDHPMESAQWGHPEDVIPFCVRSYRIYDDQDQCLFEMADNHQTINRIQFDVPKKVRRLRFAFDRPPDGCPTALFYLDIR